MSTSIAEIADGIFRISTYTEDIPGGFTFNQFLLNGDEPMLFHCGTRSGFADVAAALATVRPVEELRWISFGHWEADESGAMNQWLAAAPRATVALGALGGMISAGDQADRPVQTLDDGEVLDLGGKRIRWIDTPHVPHGWDAGLIYEESTGTLFTGDLLSQSGGASPLMDGDIVEAAAAAENMFHSTALTPATAPTLRRLAELQPTTLAVMHGSSYNGDCAAALHGAAEDYAARLLAAMSA